MFAVQSDLDRFCRRSPILLIPSNSLDLGYQLSRLYHMCECKWIYFKSLLWKAFIANIWVQKCKNLFFITITTMIMDGHHPLTLSVRNYFHQCVPGFKSQLLSLKLQQCSEEVGGINSCRATQKINKQIELTTCSKLTHEQSRKIEIVSDCLQTKRKKYFIWFWKNTVKYFNH